MCYEATCYKVLVRHFGQTGQHRQIPYFYLPSVVLNLNLLPPGYRISYFTFDGWSFGWCIANINKKLFLVFVLNVFTTSRSGKRVIMREQAKKGLKMECYGRKGKD